MVAWSMVNQPSQSASRASSRALIAPPTAMPINTDASVTVTAYVVPSSA